MSEYEIALMGVYQDAFTLAGVVGALLCLVLGLQFARLLWV